MKERNRKSEPWCGITPSQIVVALLVNNVVPGVDGIDFSKLPNLCPVDQTIPPSQPGNGYFCPDVYDDGSPNPYVECCYNDRPDELGNYYSCCKPGDEKEAEKWGKIEFIAIYIGIATAIVIVILCICVYCRKDTVHCLDGCTRKMKYHKDLCLDGLCACLCCRHRGSETEKFKLNHVMPADLAVVDSAAVASNNQLFWNPDTNEYY